ncbi:MAG: hypothetical protein ABSH48_15900 [Verrucomicrobiota bacterium]|jgi:hypothetical protein
MKANYIENNDNDTKRGNAPAGATLCRKIADFLEAVKNDVFAEYKSILGGNEQLLRLALIEAEALARQTDYPHLVFPLLAAEKAGNAARWQFRQRFLLRGSEALAA